MHSSPQIKVQALVLRSVLLGESQRILTLFSREMGKMSVVIKGVTKKNIEKNTLSQPLNLCEFVCKPGKSEIYTFLDGKLLNPFFSLRNSYPHLMAAGKIANDLSLSQMLGSVSERLFDLTIAFLKQLPNFANPETLNVVFRLKTLSLEGLLGFDGTHLVKGHEVAIPITEVQMRSVKQLLDERSFAKLQSIKPAIGLPDLVDKIFTIQY